jgi:hypothetical protein
MPSSADDPQPDAVTTADPARPRALTGVPADPPPAGRDRHPSRLGHRLDNYLAAVIRELNDRGVITGALQRTDPADRLIGSIDLDCTPLDDPSREDDIDPARPVPVDAVWDEQEGWSVGLRHSSGRRSRRYLHPDLLPEAAAVGAFVVGVARGATLGVAHSIAATEGGHPHLHLLQTEVVHDLRVWLDHAQPGTVDLLSPAAQAQPAGWFLVHTDGGTTEICTSRRVTTAQGSTGARAPALGTCQWTRSCSYSAVRMHPHALMSPVPVCRRCIGIFDLHR